MANEKRLIDANEVERKLEIAISSWWCDCNSNAPVIARAMTDALQRVKYAPTVDAVEVVRCRDCKKWEKCYSSILGEVMCCTGQANVNIQKGPDDFCSYGERRTEDGNGNG